jgi:hypothetical protein
MPDQNSKVYLIEDKWRQYMLSEQLVGVLKSKAKFIDDQIASITESEGWEIIQDIDLLNRKKQGCAKYDSIDA